MADLFSRYLGEIKDATNLGQVLDWDNPNDRDLTEIAKSLNKWRQNLRVPLQLDADDLYQINDVKDPVEKR